MDTYYDTGALIPLYVDEVFSRAVTDYTARCGVPIPFSLFHRLEFENALRLKLFRKEIDSERLKRILSHIGDDLNSGHLVLRPVNWIDAFDKARTIGADVTAKTGCRTLDLIHVTIAVQWGCPTFLTADGRQIAAAKMAGLCTVDLRELHQQRGDGRGYSGVVREQQAKYSCSSRKRGSNKIPIQQYGNKEVL
ncbi:MAG TPA: hypothetical protein DET40_12815 [Lentisphaeria bacterium]|nr:MAG: hypothetical protein A2X45_13740 [Lentisphaerae bacterium GWF2_50_93]HCE44422.1 hypothetical protein [Lentisphaeria bacterium]